MIRSSLFAAILLGAPMLSDARGAAFEFLEATMDRYNYPFAGNPDGNTTVPIFAANNDGRFDERDSQFHVRFATTSLAPAGLGAASYQLTSLQLTLTLTNGNFPYDATYDALSTYLSGGSDPDAGRPVELFGVGYRNGATAASYGTGSPFTTAPGLPTQRELRTAYAAGFRDGALVDVSNNIVGADPFEAVPFSVGQLSQAPFGPDTIPTLTFNIDLSNPLVLAHFQSSLDAGYLEFMVTTLIPTTQQSGSGYPVFNTRESALNAPEEGEYAGPVLRGELTVVPEPATWAFLVIAFGVGALWRARRHA